MSENTNSGVAGSVGDDPKFQDFLASWREEVESEGYASARAIYDKFVAYIDALLAARAAPGVPAGWKLVPIKPTSAMIDAYNDTPCGIGGSPAHGSHVWEAMLAAAPASPEGRAPAKDEVGSAEFFAQLAECKEANSLTGDIKFAEYVADCCVAFALDATAHERAPTAGRDALSLPDVLREFASDNGYSHGDYADLMLMAANEIERLSSPTADRDDEPSEREAVIACLEDDAAKLADANPDDEMAQTMREAAVMLAAPAAPLPVVGLSLEQQNMQGMADCMDMVRSELIEMGIIDKSIAPMFIANAVGSYIQSLAAAPVAPPASPSEAQEGQLSDEGSFREVAEARGLTDFSLTLSGKYHNEAMQALREKYDDSLAALPGSPTAQGDA